MTRREDLIAHARDVAERLGKSTVSRSEFVRESGVSQNQIYSHFEGGWRELCQAAGLQPHRQNVRLSDDQIFAEMRDAFLRLGGVTTRTRFDRAYRYSADVFKKRGLTWKEALKALREWCEEYDPGFAYLEDLPEIEEPSPAPKQVTPSPSGFHARLSDRRQYGEVLSFRGLLHGPTNELGVVFLFGMVSRELGFVVESVQAGYPDCEAKRKIGPGRWQRVRIEFEFRSRSFRDHGHDPSGCDLVVCWEHNYPECPVDVLELRSWIQGLRQSD